MQMLGQEKHVLDATSSFRRAWFPVNRNHPAVVFLDKRSDEELARDWVERSKHDIIPRPPLNFSNLTVQGDFCHLPYPDNYFCHIHFDPPHLYRIGKSSMYCKLFGKLDKETWRSVLGQAAKELWRVLAIYGTLNFKWNDRDIKASEVLALFPVSYLYGNSSSHGQKSCTGWYTFVKFPSFEGEKKLEE